MRGCDSRNDPGQIFNLGSMLSHFVQCNRDAQRASERIHRNLITLIELGKFASQMGSDVVEFIEKEDPRYSEDNEREFIQAHDMLMGVVQYSFDVIWDTDNGPMREHFSDLLNEGWQVWKDASDVLEEAKWAVLNNAEGLERDGPVYEEVEDLIDSLRA